LDIRKLKPVTAANYRSNSILPTFTGRSPLYLEGEPEKKDALRLPNPPYNYGGVKPSGKTTADSLGLARGKGEGVKEHNEVGLYS